MPYISIIIPIYNSEAFLKDCMESVLKQTFTDIEIICVNDGSTDQSQAIIEGYAERDKRIIIVKKENGGLSSARNAGLDRVHGKYVMFVDSDDWLEEYACEELYEVIKEKPYDVVFFDYIKNENGIARYLWDASFEIEDQQLNMIKLDMIGQIEPYDPLGLERYSSACFKAYSAEVLKKSGVVFDKVNYAEDTLFNIKYFHFVNTAYYFHAALYHYRVNRESITHAYRKDLVIKNEEVYECILNVITSTTDNAEDKLCRLHNRIALNIVGIALNAANSKYIFREVKVAIKEYSLKHRECYEQLETKRMPFIWKLTFTSIQKEHYNISTALFVLASLARKMKQ